MEDYPEYDEKLIDKELEEKIDLVRNIVSLGRSAREKVNIKVRQPLESIVVDNKYKSIIADLDSLIKEELNIKEIDYESDVSEFMIFDLKPNFKVAGPLMSKDISKFAKYLKEVNKHDFVKEIESNSMDISLDGTDYKIDKEFVEIKVDAKEGYDVQLENDLYVLLNTHLTKELLDEGYMREFVSKIQQERKNLDLDVSDRIEIKVEADDEVKYALEKYIDTIKYETLAIDVLFENLNGVESTKLNDKEIKFEIKKGDK